MAIPRPLRDPLSKYRKHKTSLDGRISGVDMPYHGNGQTASPYGHTDTSPGTPPPAKTYDPVHAQYAWTGPEYETPPPWFEGLTIPATPPIRLDPIEFEIPSPAQSDYNNSLMTEALLQNALMEAATEEIMNIPPNQCLDLPQMHEEMPFISEQASNEIHFPEPALMPMDLEGIVNQRFNEQSMAPELPDSFALMNNAHEQMTQSLEQTVSHDILPAEPISDPWDDPILKQQQDFDLQMQQLMNPLGMPGPGM